MAVLLSKASISSLAKSLPSDFSLVKVYVLIERILMYEMHREERETWNVNYFSTQSFVNTRDGNPSNFFKRIRILTRIRPQKRRILHGFGF